MSGPGDAVRAIAAEPLVLARVVQTCTACPSQWDAWTTDGRYLYLRYRSGWGTAECFLEPGGQGAYSTLTLAELLDVYPGMPPFVTETVAVFDTGDGYGEIALERFCELAGLVLPPGVAPTYQRGPLYAITFENLEDLERFIGRPWRGGTWRGGTTVGAQEPPERGGEGITPG